MTVTTTRPPRESSVVAELRLAESAEARLRVPSLPKGVVNRTALVNRLRTERPPVVVVTAPAGYGKTTVLAQWSARDARRFAWVSVGEGDDHPAMFVRELVDAIGHVAEVPAEVVAPLESRPVGARTAARRLGRWLLDHAEPLVIVVDNVESIIAAATVEVLATLCDHLPPGTQLVLSGRSVPPLPLARLRVEGRLGVLTARDLTLSNREALAMLRAAGAGVSDGDAHELNERAEGWAAGLQLAVLALDVHRGRAARPPGSITGAHHFVAEYFESEVLDALDPKAVEFATHASLLDRMSGPVCDAVLGSEGSGKRLRELALAEAFVVALDGERRTYRFHRFFREMLRSRLEQCEPATFAQLSRRVAAWHEQEGDLVAALELLRAVDDREAATRLLGAAGTGVFAGTTLAALEPSLPELADDALLAAHQSAAVTGSLVYALLGHESAAARWLEAAERAKKGGPTRAWLAALRAMLCRDGIERMEEDARAALAHTAAQSPVHALAVTLVGVSQLLHGDLQTAETTLVEASEQARAAGAPLSESIALAELSLLAQQRSSWTHAEELARAARELALGLESDANTACALAFVASARSGLRNSNWVRVGYDIDHVQRLLPRLTEALPWLAAQVRVELARAGLALNDLGSVRELLAELDVLLLACPHLGTIRTDVLELRDEVEHAMRQPLGAGASLTAAELRLLPLLTTHLTFRQIAQHLYVSRNTIKTQAISVYRKLGVSSRTEAIERAVEIGLLRPESEILEHR